MAFAARLAPILILFGLGVLLRRGRVFTENDAHLLLKLVIYVALPTYSVIAVWRMPLSTEVLLLPALAVVIVLVTTAIAWGVSRFLHLPRKTLGVFILGATLINIAFAIPFAIAGYGDEGYALMALFNFGNLFMVFGFQYMLAVRYGSEGGLGWRMLGRVVSLPPVWGLAVGVMMNLLHIPMPQVVDDTLSLAAAMTTPLIMIALGILFRPRLEKFPIVALTLFLRSGVGLLIGWLLAEIFGLQGLTRSILILSSAAPAGFNVIVYSTLEDLDSRFAANVVSASLLLGIIYMPLLVMILGQ